MDKSQGRYSAEQVQEFWTDQAIAHGIAPAASWSDIRVMEMEAREIARHLQVGDKVLDVGCANGHTTLQLASALKIEIDGLDYIPEMIVKARELAQSRSSSLLGKVNFDVGNILSLPVLDATYDKVIVIRVLINLGDFERQAQGIAECTRVLKRGGRLVLSEATVQGLSRLNALRKEWGLPPIPVPPFNFYLDEDRLLLSAVAGLKFVKVVNFASTYFVGTRVIKPLLARVAPTNVNVADPLMEFNRWLANAPAWGDYGTQKLFVFEKS